MKKLRLITVTLIFILSIICLTSQVFAKTYKYDELGRVIEVEYDSGQKIVYTYDAGGNITNVEVSNLLKLNPIGDRKVSEGQSLTITVSIAQIAGVQPIYSAYNLPQGAVFNTVTGVFTWTPDYTQAGIYNNIIFKASIGDSAVSEEISITVSDINTPTGEYVEVIDEENGITIAFDNIETSGNTTVTVSNSLPEGTNFDVNLLPIYYDIVTDAKFEDKARIKVIYDDTGYEVNESDLRLYQLKNGETIDITSPLDPGPGGNPDTEANTIEGVVEHFCYFAIGIPNRAPVANAGEDKTIVIKNSSNVDVTLNGSRSYDPDAELTEIERPNIGADGRSIVSYKWTGPFGEAEGVNPIVNIPIGEWECILTVSDGRTQSQDTVMIRIKKEENADIKTMPYALFSGSHDSPLIIRGSNIQIVGDIHTNNDIICQGSNLYLEGLSQTTGKVQLSGSSMQIGKIREDAELVEMPNWASDIKRIAQQGGSFKGVKQYTGERIELRNSMVVDGYIFVACAELKAADYIYATDDILVNAARISNVGDERVVICSENGNIFINGFSNDINGFIYAPNGTVTINSANFTLNGKIIAKKIIIRGSKINITNSEQATTIIN